MVDAGLLTGVLAGLTGSVHCLAMCGGYVVAGSTRLQPLVSARELRIGQVATQFGRLSTYLTLGAVAGAAGGVLYVWPATQRTLYVVANLVLILVAARLAYGVTAEPALERAGLAVFTRAMPLLSPWVRGSGLRRSFALGALWGLTPCALIYGLMPIALLSGDALGGAAVMGGLWIGTLPALVLAGRLARMFARPANRAVAAALIAIFGGIGLYRAFFLPLAGGPFCLS